MSHTENYNKILNQFNIIIVLILAICLLFFLNSTNKKTANSEEVSQYTGAAISINNQQQMWGQPAKDMFPDILNPRYITANEADIYLKDSDIVYFIQAKKNVYVFPQLILRHHEVVNDSIEGKPLAVTFCILSNTPRIFARTINNQTLTFRSLGPLMYGNQIMFDKQTGSFWNQLTGVSFKGKFLGKRLENVQPIEKTTWGNVKLFPSLKVLPPVLGIDFYHKNEQKNSPQARLGIGLMSMKEQKPDPRLPSNTNGMGIIVHNKAKFYNEQTVKERQMINDTVGGWSLLILNNDNLGDQRIFRRFVNGQILNFIIQDKKLVDNETKSTWNLNGTAISGPLKGTRLISPDYDTAYWYSWAAFYPATLIFPS